MINIHEKKNVYWGENKNILAKKFAEPNIQISWWKFLLFFFNPSVWWKLKQNERDFQFLSFVFVRTPFWNISLLKVLNFFLIKQKRKNYCVEVLIRCNFKSSSVFQMWLEKNYQLFLWNLLYVFDVPSLIFALLKLSSKTGKVLLKVLNVFRCFFNTPKSIMTLVLSGQYATFVSHSYLSRT